MFAPLMGDVMGSLIWPIRDQTWNKFLDFGLIELNVKWPWLRCIATVVWRIIYLIAILNENVILLI